MSLDETKIKNYCRIDSDEDISDLISAAETYIINAIEVKDKAEMENNPIFVLACEMLISHWHDNRAVIGQSEEIPFGVEAIISQLQNCYVPNIST